MFNAGKFIEEYVKSLLEKVTGGSARFEPLFDSWMIHYATNEDLQRSLRSIISTENLNSILSMATGEDDEFKRLRHWFWGELPQEDLPRGSRQVESQFRSPVGCGHEWIEVTLFHTPNERCKYCDIKKSDIK